jgi:hypothetical protein
MFNQANTEPLYTRNRIGQELFSEGEEKIGVLKKSCGGFVESRFLSPPQRLQAGDFTESCRFFLPSAVSAMEKKSLLVIHSIRLAPLEHLFSPAQDVFVIIADEAFGVLLCKSLAVEPDLEAPAGAFADDLIAVNVMSSELPEFIEDIHRYQVLDVAELNNHCLSFGLNCQAEPMAHDL